MQDETNSNSRPEKPDIDSLLADLFGLNIRGAKTLYDLFRRPKAVFESARVNDWRNRHTPTVRLVFSILTVFSLLSFFWAGEDGVLYQSLESALGDIPDRAFVAQFLPKLFASFVFIYPFVYMLTHSLIGSTVFVWGKGTSWVTRLRLYFGVASVGIAIAVLSNLVMPFVGTAGFMSITIGSAALSFIAYAVTYARGMAATGPQGRRTLRAVSLAIIITLADLIAALAAGSAAGFWAQL